MKELFTPLTILYLLSGILTIGCRTAGNKVYESSSGVKAIVNETKKQFGSQAKYSSIHMRYDDKLGFILTVSGVSERMPDSLSIRQLVNGKWTELEVTALVTDEEPLSLFSMKEIMELELLPGLVEKSIHRMAEEYELPGQDVNEILINMPGFDNGKNAVRINVYIQPKSGETTYEFAYNIAGELKSSFTN